MASPLDSTLLPLLSATQKVFQNGVPGLTPGENFALGTVFPDQFTKQMVALASKSQTSRPQGPTQTPSPSLAPPTGPTAQLAGNRGTLDNLVLQQALQRLGGGVAQIPGRQAPPVPGQPGPQLLAQLMRQRQAVTPAPIQQLGVQRLLAQRGLPVPPPSRLATPTLGGLL